MALTPARGGPLGAVRPSSFQLFEFLFRAASVLFIFSLTFSCDAALAAADTDGVVDGRIFPVTIQQSSDWW